MTERLPLNIANIALHGLHLVIVAGAGIGWMFCETRLATLALQGAIALSWVVIGPLARSADDIGDKGIHMLAL